jgi:diguanylate cyclase (GGDEF)-like protein
MINFSLNIILRVMSMRFFNSKLNIYIFSISFLGMAAFFLSLEIGTYSTSEWVVIFALTGSVLALNHFYIQLPPKGNTLSMDSAVFLASLFLLGVNTTLLVLFLNASIFAFTRRESAWWKHLLNFSIYSFMIIGSYYTFILTGGEVANVHLKNLIPYISALGTYYLINVLLVGIYFLLTDTDSLGRALKEMIKDSLATYLSTLLLSLVLMILLHAQNLFGLFLFICIAFLLSQAFKQHFELYKEVADKANKDFLTGLNNHGYFKELLEKELAAARETEKPLSVALIDIDDFKKYNDLFGHIRGDQILKEFGALIKKEAQAKGYSVARYGGEEFSFLMPNTDSQEAFVFLNDVRKKTNDTHFKGVESLPYGCLSFSAGIAEWEKETFNTAELLNKADQALYSTKDQGKNLVQIYNEHTDYSVQRSLNLEKELEEAEQQLKIFLSKDVYTYRHSKRVYQYAVDFSKKLNLSDHERKTLILGALVHDLGKIEIPRDILNKKGKLEPHEWEIMKKHVTWGKEIISTDKKLEDVVPLVELHHERYDGRGYPYGLKGKTIPKLARILCIIDSFDAMTTERPYQKTKSFEEGIIELRTWSGRQFDPEFVEPFINMIELTYNVEECNSFLADVTG